MPERKKALTLSIIIPAYNEENYLEACLKSVGNQTEKPDEVIVVDNSSDDDTARIARRFKFVKMIREEKRGVTFARDAGFNAAKSEIIGRIDADTRLPANWVTDLKRILNEDKSLDAISGPTAFYDIPFQKFNLFVNKLVRTALYYIGFKEERYLFGSNMAIKRKAWLGVKDKVCRAYGIHEDNDLAIHLILNGYKVHYTNDLVADISARRVNSSYFEAVKYAFMQYQTFRHHKIFSIQSVTTGITLLFFYPLLWILHRTYNPHTGSFSIKCIFQHKAVIRKLPMD